jgi:predicted nucleic acid-binding Zn ribbon protein
MKYDVACKNESCENFDKPFEIQKRMSEDTPHCESCGIGLSIVHLAVAAQPIFSGSGWYPKPRN